VRRSVYADDCGHLSGGADFGTGFMNVDCVPHRRICSFVLATRGDFRPSSSGWGGRCVDPAVVDEEMQFIDWKKEFHCLSLNFVGAAGRTDHEAKLTGSAMQK
jgi:hypothetical protein